MQKEQDVGSMSKSMLIVMIFMMASKITGFLRETVLAAHFGLSAVTDAYKAAFDVPCLILSVVVTALSSTLIPVYAEQSRKSQAQARRFSGSLFTLGFVLSVIIVLLTLFFLDPIVHLLIPSATPETQEMTMQLAQIMMPMGLFVFLSRLTTSYLQANFCFTIPAIAPLFLNLCIIASIMLSKGKSITYVAIGSLLGMFLQFAIQIPSATRRGLSYRPVFDVKTPGIRDVGFLMIPILIASAFDQMYLTFDRAFASGVAGDITALDYGNRIATMVSAVLLSSVATVLYPTLVKNTEDKNSFSSHLSFGVNVNLIIAIPASIALILLSHPITRLVYQRGAFTAEATLVTSGTLSCYCIGILGVGLRELCNRAFYAFKDTKIPTIVGISIVILNILLNALLYPIFGASGIAIATSISSLGSGLTLLILLKTRQQVVRWKNILHCGWKVLVSSGVMAAVLLLLQEVLSVSTRTGKPFILSVFLIIVVGVASYAVSLILLKTEEVYMILSIVKKKFFRKSAA